MYRGRSLGAVPAHTHAHTHAPRAPRRPVQPLLTARHDGRPRRGPCLRGAPAAGAHGVGATAGPRCHPDALGRKRGRQGRASALWQRGAPLVAPRAGLSVQHRLRCTRTRRQAALGAGVVLDIKEDAETDPAPAAPASRYQAPRACSPSPPTRRSSRLMARPQR